MAIKPPTKFPFSATCNEYGICGAFGLLDQGVSEQLDMAQIRARTVVEERREKEIPSP